MIAARDRGKLARVLWMLGRSPERIRRRADATWSELHSPPPAIEQWVANERPRTLDEVTALCLDHRGHLTECKRRSTTSISRQNYRRLTEKQAADLDQIVKKISSTEKAA